MELLKTKKQKILLSLIILMFFVVLKIGYAQQNVVADSQKQQSIINAANQNIANDNADIAIQQGVITTATAQLNLDNAQNAAYVASIAQTAAGVNWDYFVTLEPQIPFATWSKVDNGINWTSIVPSLGINCGGITEANVNWNNWGNCEANGMTPGLPFGGKNTGIAAFWCGNGSINGTC